MPLQRWKLGEETSLTPSVAPSTTSNASRTEALSIPENPIKGQSAVPLRWLIGYYKKKMQGHQSISHKYVFKGQMDKAEAHRHVAMEHKRKTEDLRRFRDRRMN